MIQSQLLSKNYFSRKIFIVPPKVIYERDIASLLRRCRCAAVAVAFRAFIKFFIRREWYMYFYAGPEGCVTILVLKVGFLIF